MTDQHQKGIKLDQGKQRPDLVMAGFAHALHEVAKVSTFGAEKYTDGASSLEYAGSAGINADDME